MRSIEIRADTDVVDPGHADDVFELCNQRSERRSRDARGVFDINGIGCMVRDGHSALRVLLFQCGVRGRPFRLEVSMCPPIVLVDEG